VLPLKAATRALEDVTDEVGRLEAADDAVPPAIQLLRPIRHRMNWRSNCLATNHHELYPGLPRSV
jgi:hypothetical protein